MAKKTVQSRVDRVEIPVMVKMPLGYLGMCILSGRSWDEELVDALKALGVTRDERLVVTIAREEKS